MGSCLLAYAPDSSSHSSHNPTPTSADAYLDRVVSMISTPSASFIAGPPPKTTAAAPLLLSPIPNALALRYHRAIIQISCCFLLLMSLLLLFITTVAVVTSTAIAAANGTVVTVIILKGEDGELLARIRPRLQLSFLS